MTHFLLQFAIFAAGLTAFAITLSNVSAKRVRILQALKGEFDA